MNNLVSLNNNGVAVTTSLVIAEQLGRKHSHVLQSIRSLKESVRISPISYIDSMNRAQIMYELPEREALIVMPFVGGKKSVEGQIRLVDAFLALRNMAIERSPIEERLDRMERELASLRQPNPQTARIVDDDFARKSVLNCINNGKNTYRDIAKHCSGRKPFRRMPEAYHEVLMVIRTMVNMGVLKEITTFLPKKTLLYVAK